MAASTVLRGTAADVRAPRLSLQNIDAMVLFTYFHAKARNRVYIPLPRFSRRLNLIG